MPTGKIVSPPSMFKCKEEKELSTKISTDGFLLKISDENPHPHPDHKKDRIVFIPNPDGKPFDLTKDVVYDADGSICILTGKKNPTQP